MKKFLIILLMVAMGLLFSGCFESKPEDAVNKFFKSVQKFDLEAMRSSVDGSVNDGSGSIEELTGESSEGLNKYFLDYIKDNANEISYKVTGSEINGDTGTVKVECEYVDSGDLLGRVVAKAFPRLLGLAFSGVEPGEDEVESLFLSILEEEIVAYEKTRVKVVLDIDVVKKDGIWYIAEVDDDLLDVVLSGLYSASKELSESLNFDN